MNRRSLDRTRQIVELFFVKSQYLSQELRDNVSQWMADRGETPELDAVLNGILESGLLPADVSRDELRMQLETLRRRLDMPEFDENVTFESYRPRKKRSLARVALRVAAVVVPALLVGAISFLLLTRGVTDSTGISAADTWIVTGVGEQRFVTLPDSSRTWLNSNSSLAYNAQGFEQERRLTLTGEAFFDVRSDREHPFRVGTKNMDVEVLGTRFGVREYENDASGEVTLAEGSVEVSAGDKRLVLVPDQRFTYDVASRDVKVETVDAASESSWRTAALNLSGVTVGEALERVAQYYGITLRIEGTLPQGHPVTIETVDEVSLDDMLGTLSLLSSGFTYEIDGTTVTIRP